MDITVYLPDDIGKEAKAAQLNLSGILRRGVLEELMWRQATETIQEAARKHDLNVEVCSETVTLHRSEMGK